MNAIIRSTLYAGLFSGLNKWGFQNGGIFLDIFLFLKKEMNMEHTPSEHESFNDDIYYTDDDSSVSESEE